MKLKKVMSLTAVAVTGVMLAGQPVMAAEVSENTPEQDVQQKIVLEKTEEVVPTYTVDVPATVTLSKDAQNLSFSMNLENHEDFIPDGKKISVVIESAGYPTELNKFAVWDSRNLQEASYEIYYSDAMSGGRYSIGDEIVSWEGSDWGTQNRRIKALNYDSIEPGNYSGVINYSISLTDK